MRENGHYHKENGGDYHGMGGREARLAGTIWAGGKNDEFTKNNVDYSHYYQRWDESKETAIDFFDGFTSNPLIETEACEYAEH